MLENRFGIIDIGSNTFHLLIVDFDKGGFETVFKLRKFVGLAEEGIKTLSLTALSRGEEALSEFKSYLADYQVSNFKAIGTAALRTSTNGASFVKKIKTDLGIHIELIDGDREADLIFKGVRSITNLDKGNHYIMDIGGGSVEYIHIENGHKKWAKSFNIGVGVLHNAFEKSNPLSSDDKINIEEFITSELAELIAYHKNVSCDKLILSLIHI